MPLNPPSDLIPTIISSSRIDYNWINNDSYQYIEFWIKEGVGPYELFTILPGYTEYYSKTNLLPDTEYTVKVRGGIFEPPQESDFSNEAVATTYSELQDPSNAVAIPFSNTEIEITFKDNSTAEDGHKIQRRIAPDAWVDIITLPPNVEFYRDSGLSNADVYEYRVYAYQGLAQSGYSNIVSAQPYQAPGVPANPIASEIIDKQMRISWEPATGEITGYKIEKSLDGLLYEEIIIVDNDVLNFLFTELSPSTQYWFRLKTYGPGGDSGYSNVVTATTLDRYIENKFDKLTRKPVSNMFYLFEVNPKMILSGFILTEGKLFTYELVFQERGAKITNIFENSNEYKELSSINDVEGTEASWFFDYYNKIIYIHTSTGDDPIEFLIEASFWLNFIMGSGDSQPIIYNENIYWPLIPDDGIPEISQENKPYYEGSLAISSGSISLINTRIHNEYFFDKIYNKYTWDKAKAILKAGSDDFNYSEFYPIFTGRVFKKTCNDKRFILSLRDVRQDMDSYLILEKLKQEDYPDIEEDYIGAASADGYGYKPKTIPIPIDRENKKFKYFTTRSKTVIQVRKNTEIMTAGTDYYVDFQRSIITFDRDAIAIDEKDIIEVDFIGRVNSSDEPITNAADIFKHIMQTHRNISVGDLELDSIYDLKLHFTKALSPFFYRDTRFDTIVQNIEHSSKASTFQDGLGRLGLKRRLTQAPSNIKSIRDYQISEPQVESSPDSIYWKVNVHYAESPQDQKWKTEPASNENIKYIRNTEKEFDVYVYYENSFDAKELAIEILELINKDYVDFTVDALLFGRFPGDLALFNRNRFYNLAGAADDLLLRIIRISKSPSTKKTLIKAEEAL